LAKVSVSQKKNVVYLFVSSIYTSIAKSL